MLKQLVERKIAQWAIAYLAGAWVLVQVVDVIGSQFGISTHLVRGLTIVLVFGFLVTLTLAWYHGERGHQRVTAPEAALLITIAMAAVVTTPRLARDAAEAPATVVLSDVPVVAALPFENVGNEESDQFFADGVHDELLTRLSSINALKVISRTSVMTYRGTNQPLREIASQLGATSVLEGTVRRGGETIRVTARLIDASTDERLWGQTYDRVFASSEILAIQSDIARQVALALEASLSPHEAVLVDRRETDNLNAYTLYLQGNDYLNRATRGYDDRVETAERLFERAIAEDSAFALPWARLSYIQSMKFWFGVDKTPRLLESARTHAEKALALTPGLPEGHLALGYFHYWGRRDYAAALQELETAALARPRDANVMEAMANVLRRSGDFDGALAVYRRALEVDPRSLRSRLATAQTLQALGQIQDAEREYARLTDLDPLRFHAQAFNLYWRSQGDTLGARRFLERNSRHASEWRYLWQQAWLSFARRDYPSALDLARGMDFDVELTTDFAYMPTLFQAHVLRIVGDDEEAERLYQTAVELAEAGLGSNPEDHRFMSALAIAYAGLGDSEESERWATEAAEVLPLDVDHLSSPLRLFQRAIARATLGDAAGAIDDVEQVMGIHAVYGIGLLEVSPLFDQIRADARFQELLRTRRVLRSEAVQPGS